MKKKGTPASPAVALANKVLPVPGGPVNSTPFGSFPPRPVNLVGSLRKSTISSNSARASSAPLTSSNFTVTVDMSTDLLLTSEFLKIVPFSTRKLKPSMTPGFGDDNMDRFVSGTKVQAVHPAIAARTSGVTCYVGTRGSGEDTLGGIKGNLFSFTGSTQFLQSLGVQVCTFRRSPDIWSFITVNDVLWIVGFQ
ncbi:hypothetical protein WICPIJ_002113 [Wickerhamomyces pijperi]|uniref:Uncharacterized protein n=1 Tax=Wickerhamomyces pijperi TaxID=599730 RepID=A0A9P8QCE9_WICPI|nr:hypothetical protein WICPIJ_002113 [Wickerhamomyces pijperi]